MKQIECSMCKAWEALEKAAKTLRLKDVPKNHETCKFCKGTGFKTIEYTHSYSKPRSAMTGLEWLEADRKTEWESYLLETANDRE